MKKVFSLFSLALIPAIFAAPADDAQVILGETDPVQRPGLNHLHGVEGIINKGKEIAHQWAEDGKQFIKQHGLTCKSVFLV
jgi:cathepsin A (carboxypeptidase C)